MFMARCELGTASEAWAYVAEAFANEIRHDAIPWAHKALDEVGAPKGPDLAGRIRAFSASRPTEAPARLTENAMNACKAFDAPTDPSDAVVYLATLLDERDAVREELRAIIVEAIKGGA
jgi:hypothetical protein